MTVLITIALKSLLIAGLTLGLLQLLKSRSAAERSWVAHTGLLVLIIMAFAPVVLPAWRVEAPALLQQSPDAVPAVQIAKPLPSASPNSTPKPLEQVAVAPRVSGMPTLTATAATTALYAVPAAVLLVITLLALLRLFALRARADVLVDGHWLSALARAQRRMGFKHGTALLTSNELASPISWGLMRPVILLNNRAIEAADEAEAIIAHELAHVARMDWIKLLLARFATALFWFNPLVWMLAREAHQLREEAADDSVLAADIVDTDYAQLLVGVARHECPGLLLGAHGVAPSKSSLARRVARVLDGKSVRGPVARSFALGVFAGAVLVAAPLAALTIAPASPKAPKVSKALAGKLAVSEPVAPHYPEAPEVPADLPHIIARGVSTTVATATAAIVPEAVRTDAAEFKAVAPNGASVESMRGKTVSRAPSGATVTVYPPDANGRRRIVAVAPSGATSVTYADADDGERYAGRARRASRENAIDAAITMKAVGMTPEYAAAMRAASPALRSATLNDLIELKAVGVTPDYVRDIARAGFASLRPSEIQEARAVGLSADYMRAIRATGVAVTLDDLIELRAMGVRPDELARVRGSGPLTLKRIHELRGPPRPPQPPEPPEDDDGG